MENASGLGGDEIFVDLKFVFHAMRGRHSSKPIDKVCAIALPLQRRDFDSSEKVICPIYDSRMPVSTAWNQLICSIASIKISFKYVPSNHPMPNILVPDRLVTKTLTNQLLCLFPHPSRDHWFPSWDQVQQYPDVSVKENGPALAAGSMDYSLHITHGRIYRECSLRLIQRPTPEKKAIYCATVDGKDAQLVATVRGIEPQIDSERKYVLVDITPDGSLWPGVIDVGCLETNRGHEHPPIWDESVIVVCEEVDTLAQPVANTVWSAQSSSATMRYCLRRVTTLLWDCRLTESRLSGLRRWLSPRYLLSPRRRYWHRAPVRRGWLPFNPSLMHMSSVVCSAKAEPDNAKFDDEREPVILHPVKLLRCPDVFCDPVVVEDLLRQDGWHEEWDKRCPVYDVYLV